MTQTQAEKDLAALEAPHHEQRAAAHELATLKTLMDTVPHEGAKAAIQADLAAAEKRHSDAVKAVQASGVTQQDIDQAAQRVIDEREE